MEAIPSFLPALPHPFAGLDARPAPRRRAAHLAWPAYLAFASSVAFAFALVLGLVP